MVAVVVALLGDHLVFGSQLGQGPRLVDGARQPFLAVGRLPRADRRRRGRRVVVVARGDDHGVDLLAHLVEHHAVVLELGHVGKLLETGRRSLLVHVAHRHDAPMVEQRAILALVAKKRGAPAAAADQCEAQPFIRGVAAR